MKPDVFSNDDTWHVHEPSIGHRSFSRAKRKIDVRDTLTHPAKGLCPSAHPYFSRGRRWRVPPSGIPSLAQPSVRSTAALSQETFAACYLCDVEEGYHEDEAYENREAHQVDESLFLG